MEGHSEINPEGMQGSIHFITYQFISMPASEFYTCRLIVIQGGHQSSEAKRLD